MSAPGLVATAIVPAPASGEAVTLRYEARLLRRKVLTGDAGTRFLVDLEHAASVGAGDAFLLSDGRRLRVRPAPEPLLEVTGAELTRLAWHIGNRHAPCQIGRGRLLIQPDHVLWDMLARLGATLREVTEPFTPEGGAYGHGRVQSHAH